MEKIKTFREIGDGYTAEEKKAAFEDLNLQYQKIFERAYGEDLSGNKRKLTKEEQKQFNIASTMFKKKLKYLRKVANEKPKTIYDYYLDYTEEEVKQAFSLLNKQYQSVIIKTYGESFVENYYSILTPNEKKLLKSAREEIKRKIASSKKGSLPFFKTLFDYYPDYTEEAVKHAFSLLNKQYQSVIIKTYGESFLENHYSILTPNEKKLLKSAREEIKRQEKCLQAKISPKFKNLFDYYPEYTEEEVKSAFTRINETYKKIIEKAYGKDLNETNYNTLTKAEQELLKRARNGHLKQLENPKELQEYICEYLKVDEINDEFLETLETNTIKDLKYIFEYILNEKPKLTEEEKRYYSAVLLKLKFLYTIKDDFEIEDNYYWEKVANILNVDLCHKYISTLTPINQLIINAKLGFLDDGKIYSHQSIAKATQLPIEDVHKIIIKTLSEIRNFMAEYEKAKKYKKEPTKQ